MRRSVLVLAVAALAAGCNGGDPARSALGTPTTSAPPISPAASTPSAAPARSSAAVGSKDFGYLTKVIDSGTATTPAVVSFDRALFLTGQAADKAAAAHGQETPVPNDYFIQNDNTLLRTLQIDPAAKVIGSLQLNSFATKDDYSVDPKPQELSTLVRFLQTSMGQHCPFHLVYGEGGRVIRVEEQYVP